MEETTMSERFVARERDQAQVIRELEEFFALEPPLADMPTARAFVRQCEEEMAGLTHLEKVGLLKDVAKAYDNVRCLANHSRALRERVQELNREAGL